MKNKVAAILILTMIAGSMLVGCGGNTENDMTNTEVVSSETADADKEIAYVEMEACFQVEDAADIDTSLVDGETLSWASWERVETKIRLTKSIDIYDMSKGKIGYTKEDIVAIYTTTNGEWSNLAIGESGYGVYVKTEDLLAAMGDTEPVYEEGTDVFLITNGVYGDEYSDGENIDMNALEPASSENILTKEINIYSQGKRTIGYLKADTVYNIVTQSEEWSYVSVTDGQYIVRTEDLKNASMITEVSTTLYAQSSVNVRKGPGLEYEKLGNLSTNQEITVTGQASNGWYRIDYEGESGYVSENYLADTQVEIVVETPQETTPVQTTPAVNYPAGDYTPGSVYGPKLSQQELNQVAEAVNVFLASYDFASMDEYTKVLTAHDYLCARVSYAPSWAENRANTAWGALVYGEAQCSGYARAMKALCDAMGVGCYYVHADEYASNPSHQWNVVGVNGNWYIIDVQCNDSSGWNAFFLVSDETYAAMAGMSWDRSSVPACPYDYMGY